MAANAYEIPPTIQRWVLSLRQLRSKSRTRVRTGSLTRVGISSLLVAIDAGAKPHQSASVIMQRWRTVAHRGTAAHRGKALAAGMAGFCLVAPSRQASKPRSRAPKARGTKGSRRSNCRAGSTDRQASILRPSNRPDIATGCDRADRGSRLSVAVTSSHQVTTLELQKIHLIQELFGQTLSHRR